jgi:RimJ/RimL family protein N-acetyltransferase
MKATPLPEQIAAERITLKKHSLEIAEQMFGYVDQDRERLRVFLPWVDSTRSVEDERGYIKMTHDKWASNELFDFGIFRNSDSLYLGNCGIHSIAWPHNRCEIGYWILGAFEGQGFISEAVRALEKTLFEIGFNRVEIHCSSSNARSASVPRSNGYQLEGTLRQDAIENGTYRDTFVFAKLKSDWLSEPASR